MSTRYIVGDALIAMKNVRNKGYSSSKFVVMYSKFLISIFKKIEEAGYIKNVQEVCENGKKNISSFVKFSPNGSSLIRVVKLISKPSARVYCNVDKLKHLNVKNPFSLLILSTPLGVLTSSEAIQKCVGGELICEIF